MCSPVGISFFSNRRRCLIAAKTAEQLETKKTSRGRSRLEESATLSILAQERTPPRFPPANRGAMKTEGPGHCIAAAVVTLQLVICAQLFVSLFPKWDGGLAVGPNLVCMMGRDDRVECTPISGNAAVCDAVAFCSYAPLPLTLFAGLSFLFGARLPDADALRLSAAGQALAATVALVAVASSVVGYGNLVLLPGFATAIANIS
ncbi:hypothetical protein ANANG_G00136500 [Anguilla anguilla]|uniref:Uncharacterized protein n=1 Tax=Anguilla anguilla TaxID=7936 RepID=A0A9D3RW24_ANGAN|nr:hypothetical protein ANANG_G00136500 [Anguilla anguilla]